MIIALLIAVAPGPAIPVARAPPPSLAVSAPSTPASPRITVPVRVRVTAGDRQLYQGTLRVARNATANYSENRNEAPQEVCEGNRYSGLSERHSLSVQLTLRDDEQVGQAVHVSVSWKSPSEALTCGGEGSRSVEMVQTVPLAPGQTATLRGDGGLSVTVSR